MAIAKPIRQHNAIEAMAFVLTFSRAFDAAEVTRLATLRETLRSDLPRFETTQGIAFHIGMPNITQQATPSGVLLQRFKEDGTPAWVVRATDQNVVVNCLDYDSWQKVWPQAKRFMTEVVRQIASETNPLSQITLQVIDKFIYETDPEPYLIGDVFNPDSQFLPANTLAVGPLWHVYQGWFVLTMNDGEGPAAEAQFANRQLLNVLNLSSANIDGRLTASIDHLAQVTFKDNLPKALSSASDEENEEFLQVAFKGLLQPNNKVLMRNVLSREQLIAIGLEDQ
ncbi:TIGR04255 family protein [Burkholderia sp. AU19243]|uniref:TIGR04255 family protein n=1 Tax=Burkholderia sp. AU19243 TaxID=2824810 RepID=UPI001B90878D|nr:TIGR04255 family protein [Burkholderia sp. AU19243]MBR8366921.1 TIGR04255 family protein [Burkholderia sp. AU19243]